MKKTRGFDRFKKPAEICARHETKPSQDINTMNSGHNIFIILAVAAMFSLFGFIVYGNKGLAELNMMRETRDTLIRKNDNMIQKNLSLYRTIERLRNDLGFIENIARHELGLVEKDEIIFKLAETEPEEIRQTEQQEIQQTEQGETGQQ